MLGIRATKVKLQTFRNLFLDLFLQDLWIRYWCRLSDELTASIVPARQCLRVSSVTLIPIPMARRSHAPPSGLCFRTAFSTRSFPVALYRAMIGVKIRNIRNTSRHLVHKPISSVGRCGFFLLVSELPVRIFCFLYVDLFLNSSANGQANLKSIQLCKFIALISSNPVFTFEIGPKQTRFSC